MKVLAAALHHIWCLDLWRVLHSVRLKGLTVSHDWWHADDIIPENLMQLLSSNVELFMDWSYNRMVQPLVILNNAELCCMIILSKTTMKFFLEHAGLVGLGAILFSGFTGSAGAVEEIRSRGAIEEPKISSTIEEHHLSERLSSEQALERGFRMSSDAAFGSTGANQYRLEKGSILAHKSGALQLLTAHCTIQISSGAAVLVIVEPTVTRVLDLFDSHVGSVKVTAKDKTFKTAPGAQITVVGANKQAEVAHLLLKDGVRRRQVRVVPVAEDCFVVCDEFSIVDAVTKHELLHRLHTAEDRESKRLMEDVLKTAAALVVGGSKEPYTTVHP